MPFPRMSLDPERVAREWDPTAPHSPVADADVAAIARWAVAAMDNEKLPHSTESASGNSDSSNTTELSTAGRKRGGQDDVPRARREEKSSLTDEIRLLESRLELLKVRAGVRTGDDQRSLASVQASNFAIEEAIHTNLLDMGWMHTLLSQYMQTMPVGPMTTHIRLPKDPLERRATLRSLRPLKLRRAKELLANRCQFVDNTKQYATDERFVANDGVYHCKRFEILPFPAVRDAKPVFDALLSFFAAMGPTLRTRSSDETIREDLEVVDPAVWHRRMVTTIGGTDIEQELHIVGFARFDRTASDHGPMGFVAADSVDVDELYPYKPQERIRKDVTAAIRVSSEPATGDPTRRIVVLRRSTHLQLHPSPIPLPEGIEDDMRARMADWCRALNAFVREAVQCTENGI